MAIDLLRGAAERANALRAGVILIGGNSTRMGTDKSALVLDGQTMLDRTIAAISPLVGEILIVGKPGSNTGHPPAEALRHSEPSTATILGMKPSLDLGALLGNLGRPNYAASTGGPETGRGTGGVSGGVLGALKGASALPGPGPTADAGGIRGLEHAAQTASLTIRRVADRWPGQGPLGGILSAFASTTAMEILVVAVDLPWLSSTSLRALCSTPMIVFEDTSAPQGQGVRAGKASKLRTEGRTADCVMTLHQTRQQPLHARYTRRCEALMGAKFAGGERSIVRCELVVAQHHAHDDDRSSVDVDTPEQWESVKPR